MRTKVQVRRRSTGKPPAKRTVEFAPKTPDLTLVKQEEDDSNHGNPLLHVVNIPGDSPIKHAESGTNSRADVLPYTHGVLHIKPEPDNDETLNKVVDHDAPPELCTPSLAPPTLTAPGALPRLVAAKPPSVQSLSSQEPSPLNLSVRSPSPLNLSLQDRSSGNLSLSGPSITGPAPSGSSHTNLGSSLASHPVPGPSHSNAGPSNSNFLGSSPSKLLTSNCAADPSPSALSDTGSCPSSVSFLGTAPSTAGPAFSTPGPAPPVCPIPVSDSTPGIVARKIGELITLSNVKEEKPAEEEMPELVTLRPLSIQEPTREKTPETPTAVPQMFPDETFPCLNDNCGKTYSSVRARSMHMYFCSKQRTGATDSTDARPSYPCPDCDKVFLAQNLLLLHSLKHLKDFPFVCSSTEDCDRAFKTKTELDEHQRTHDQKRYPCGVPGCPKTFRSKQGRSVHSLKHNSPLKSFRCDSCPGRTYLTAALLKQHMDNKHTTQGSQCAQCGKTFPNSSSLRQHALVHSDDRPYACPKSDCDKSFKCRGDLRRHVMGHSDLKPYSCPDHTCTMSFKTRGDLKKHSVVHTNARPHECPTCNKCFKSPEHLRKHRFHHSTSKDRVFARYPCPIPGCERVFPVPVKLKHHLQRHGADRPYRCSLCPKAFKVEEDLRGHEYKGHGMRSVRSARGQQEVGGRAVFPVYTYDTSPTKSPEDPPGKSEPKSSPKKRATPQNPGRKGSAAKKSKSKTGK